MQTQLYPIDLADDSLESLLIRRSRGTNSIYIVTLLAVIAALGALPFVRAGVSVQGRGVVRPTTEKYQVHARISGFADEVAVRENQRVKRGQTLLRMRRAPLDVKRSLVVEQIAQSRGFIHDLQQLAHAASPAMIEPDDFLTPKYRQEIIQFRDELGTLKIGEEKAARDAERARALWNQSLISRSEVDDQEFALSQLRSRSSLVTEKYQSGWQAELTTALADLRQLESQRAQIEQEGALYSVNAPVAGTVEQLVSVSRGSYIRAGEQLMTLSPSTALVAETYLAPRDIGLVHVGTSARILVDAFNSNEWGFLGGQVSQISDDYRTVNDQPMFRVTVALDSTHLELRNGFRGELKKGMTLRVRFMVAERSLFQLLRDDVGDWLNPVQSG